MYVYTNTTQLIMLKSIVKIERKYILKFVVQWLSKKK